MNTRKKHPKKSWLLILAVVLSLLPVLTKAQEIIVPEPTPAQSTHVFNFTVGTDVGIINIPLSPTSKNNVLWSFENLPAGRTDIVMENGQEVSFKINGLQIKLPTGAATLPGTAGSATAQIMLTPDATTPIGFPINFRIRVITESGGVDFETGQRDYQINILRKPLDLSLVLDRSGSMAWSLDGSNYSPPPGESRWELLKEGVDIMAYHLSLLSAPEDLIQVRLFANNDSIVPSTAPFNAQAPVPMTTGLPALDKTTGALWTGLNPLGGTPLGNGILAGRTQILQSAILGNNHNKAMIVFSDGEQNTGNQQVKTTMPDAYIKTVMNETLRGNPPNDIIKIYTVNLGFSGIAPDMMQKIGEENGGSFLNNGISGTVTDINTYFLSAAFTNAITDILAGNSPQFIDFRTSVFPATPAGAPVSQESFFVNKGASTLIVTLLGTKRRYEPHFTSITKDGKELIQYVKQHSKDGYISFSIKFPVPGLNIGSEGEWVVKTALGANPGKSLPYGMMVIADDHGLKPTYSLGAKNIKVGQTIQPKVSLRYRGKSLDNAKVELWIVRPGDDINDLVALAKTQFEPQPGDSSSPGAAKLAALMKDSAFVKRIMNQQGSITLAYDKTAEAYTASFNDLKVAGVYQAIYRISGKDTALGIIERFHQESFYVRFPDIDPKNTKIAVSTDPSGNSVITFIPQTSQGRLIGSGWASTITLDESSARVTNIVDKGDGSYEIHVKGKVAEPVKISVAGEPAYTVKTKLTADADCDDPNAGFLTRVKCWLAGMGLPSWIIWVILAVLAGVLVLLGKKKKKQ